MNSVKQYWRTALTLLLLSMFSTWGWADPPNIVGRISVTSGQVSMFTERDDGWKPAQHNYPITSENSIWTQGNGRAEIRIGANALRVGDDTVLDFIQVDDTHMVSLLQHGMINIRLRNLAGTDEVRINTGAVRLLATGRYHIESNENESRLTVLAGRAMWFADAASGNEGGKQIETGKTLVVAITKGKQANAYLQTAVEDVFDKWAALRDDAWDNIDMRLTQDSVISPYMTGYEELDAHGDWREEAKYGRIWIPRSVGNNWAPYRDGHWAWVSPWGWTWVDNAAWGFAPFHYGRWVLVRDRWAWWPGSYRYRPVYAPALVAWNGDFNNGLSISIGGQIGWFPLAPYEPFLPSYSSNSIYIQNLNRIYNNRPLSVLAPNRYRHQAPGLTVVEHNTFIHSGPVNGGVNHASANGGSGNARATNYVPRPTRDNNQRDVSGGNVPNNNGRVERNFGTQPRYQSPAASSSNTAPNVVNAPNAAPANSAPTQMPSRRYEGSGSARPEATTRLPSAPQADVRPPETRQFENRQPDPASATPKPMPRRNERSTVGAIEPDARRENRTAPQNENRTAPQNENRTAPEPSRAIAAIEAPINRAARGGRKEFERED